MKFAPSWVFLAVFDLAVVSSFTAVNLGPQTLLNAKSYSPSSTLWMSTTDEETKENVTELYIPLSFQEMVKQVSSAMEDAYAEGKTRQMVRLLLPRSSENDLLLQYYEDDAEVDLSKVILAPPDETWQGGIMQLYRAASFSCQEILR
jgi:hypothetical protein